MKIPYSIQGALFGPACASLLFLLKISCPPDDSGICFADNFITPIFLPIPFFKKFFGDIPAITSYEPLFILGYWLLVGLLAGLCYDIYQTASEA